MRLAFYAPLALAVAYCFGLLAYAGVQAKELPSQAVQYLLFWLAAFALPAALLSLIVRSRSAADRTVAVLGGFLLLLSIWLGQSGYVGGDPTSRTLMLPLMCVPFWVALFVPLLLAKAGGASGSEEAAPTR